ncbi:hypothetical protein E2C01_047199 [Portunus trituberculatus]|uniref:Uncharacterized protein n=1 Tax=Portunus trituberculatus TaxID=210409 RepID=A0A5B7FZT1_PORTR|nr:hypothetical protein [Portunus trituberculatus]
MTQCPGHNTDSSATRRASCRLCQERRGGGERPDPASTEFPALLLLCWMSADSAGVHHSLLERGSGNRSHHALHDR